MNEYQWQLKFHYNTTIITIELTDKYLQFVSSLLFLKQVLLI